MTQVWIYAVSSSHNPDAVDCVVPWRVDDALIFFRPCKTRIRERLRKQYLMEGRNRCKVTDDLFIVGVNGSNSEKVRKVIWAGKLSEVMTFAEADSRLSGDRFRALRDHESSPLHLRPVVRRGNLVGYDHVSDEHIDDDAWIWDLATASAQGNIHVEGRRLLLRRGTPWQVFDRDCCMLLDNLLFARGEGVELDEKALTILRQVQPERSGIDRYAIFGRTPHGQAIGLRGTYLQIEGEPANRFVAWLTAHSNGAVAQSGHEGIEGQGSACALLATGRHRRTNRCSRPATR